VSRAAEWLRLAVRKGKAGRVNRSDVAANSLREITAGGTLLQRAMDAPAGDLANAYMTNVVRVRLMAVAEGGGTLVTPTETLRADNIGSAKRETQSKLSTYAAAIVDRGYRSIGGRYMTTATTSCERTGSAWAGGIRLGHLREVHIHHDAFELTVTQSADPKAKRSAFDMPGAIVESDLAFVDSGNSELMFRGMVASDKITIQVDDVDGLLARWPKWAGPPSRADLIACTVTLTPLPNQALGPQ
jgi:hypothetical protein